MSADEEMDKFSVFDAPSIGADPNANPSAFKIAANMFYQTVSPSGTITKDQVFSTATTDEVVPPDAIAQYTVYLQMANKVKPVRGLSPEEFSINQRYIDESTRLRKKALDQIAGTSFSEAKLAIISKEPPIKGSATAIAVKSAQATNLPSSVTASPTASTRPLSIIETASKQDTGITAPQIASKDFAAIPPDEGVYAYTPAELYVDRYDFETGKKIRVGIAGGAHGGAGNNTTVGDTTQTVEQSEPSPSGPQ
tara:strand:- start:493 stop:1248 length:756 start_codon:yes stop_codon:yes gene_type:complete